jgi:nucleoside-diphosphate-sugar epimerase
MSDSPVILITGGGGFVGSRFSEIIFLTGFARARVGVRNWAGAARAARLPVDIVLCDVLDRRQTTEAMKGVRAVVHCAVGDTPVIVEGTRNVLDAAARTGVERVIHISTAEVYGRHVSGRIDETWPCTLTGNAYGDAKIQAEEMVWEYSSRGLAVTVFRPSIVYGPWCDVWTAALAQRLQSGRWARYEGCADGACNLVYVDDLVAAALTSIYDDNAVGQTFNIVGPDLVSWNEYFERLNAAIGRPPLDVLSTSRARAQSMVTGVFRGAAGVVLDRYGAALMRIYERGGVLSTAMKQVKGLLNTRPSSSEFDDLYNRKAIYDWSKVQRVLGWRPAVDLDKGLRLSVDWMKYAGVLR